MESVICGEYTRAPRRSFSVGEQEVGEGCSDTRRGTEILHVEDMVPCAASEGPGGKMQEPECSTLW